MNKRVEDIRRIFYDSIVIPVIEQNVGPLQVLVASGSVITQSEFDCQGPNTSDIDYIAITIGNFGRISIPDWQTLQSQDNILQTEGGVQGRNVHLRAYSRELIQKNTR